MAYLLKPRSHVIHLCQNKLPDNLVPFSGHRLSTPQVRCAPEMVNGRVSMRGLVWLKIRDGKIWLAWSLLNKTLWGLDCHTSGWQKPTSVNVTCWAFEVQWGPNGDDEKKVNKYVADVLAVHDAHPDRSPMSLTCIWRCPS